MITYKSTYIMKNIIALLAFVLVFILANSTVKAQPYTTAIGGLNDTVRWELSYCNLFEEPSDLFAYGDTLIDSNYYKKLCAGPIGVYEYTADVEDNMALLREDYETGKVWMRDYVNDGSGMVEQEVLLMDMSLEMGDSIQIPILDIHELEWVHVISVFSLYGRKVIEFDYPVTGICSDIDGNPVVYDPGINLQFIEGVGTNSKWVFQFNQADRYQFVSKQFRNGMQSWPILIEGLTQNCINFNNLNPDLTYGPTSGYEDGAIIQTYADEYQLRLHQYDYPFNPTEFIGLTPEIANNYQVDSLEAHLEGAYLDLDFDAAVVNVFFDYENNGDVVLFAINNWPLQAYEDFEATFEDVYTEISGGVQMLVSDGQVEITANGPISNIRFGGQEVTIDNICYENASLTSVDCHAFFQTEIDGPQIQFYGQFVNVNPPVSFSWEMNGAPLNTVSVLGPTFTAPAPGTYVACFTITAEDDCNDSYCQSIEITDMDANCTDFVELTEGTVYNPTNSIMGIPLAFENNIGIGFSGLELSTGGLLFGNATVLAEDKLHLENMMLLLDYTYNLQNVSTITLTCEGAITAVQINGIGGEFYENGLVDPSSGIYTYTFDLNDLPADETFETLLFGGEDVTIHSVCFEELDPVCEASFNAEITESLFGYSIGVNSTSTADSDITNYQWFINGDLYTDYTDPSFIITFEAETSLTICLTIVTASGCVDNVCQFVGEGALEVWPGDANNDGIANNFDLLSIGLAYSTNGNERLDASTNWEAQTVNAWPEITPDLTNYAHSDCDGNGIVENADVAVLTLNYGLETGKTEWTTEGTDDDPPLYVELPEEELVEGNPFDAPIILGSEDAPIQEVYGLAFTINYDPAILDETTLEVTFNNSWLGEEASEIITLYKTFTEEGQIDIAISRIDQNNISGFGRIASVGGIIDNIAGKDEDLVDWAFSISNVRAITNNENEVLVNPVDTETSVELLGNDDVVNIQISPNPASNIIKLALPQIQNLEAINIYNIQGQLIKTLKPAAITEAINISSFRNGLYLVQAKYADKVLTKKLQVLQ